MVNYRKLDLENSINSGQIFLWEKNQTHWYGINGQNILKINLSGKIKSFEGKKIDFFRENDNLEKILKTISKDKVVKHAVEKYLGLRLLRQDPFQCFISFIVSSNSSIQKIRTCLESICKNFGKKVSFENKDFFLFPEPKTLASVTIQDLKNCGAGYRSEFIKRASEMVVSGKINFEHLKKDEYYKAKNILLQVPGVGDKVADCILLFSLEKLEAFPLDRWMIRILEKYYNGTFKISTKTITPKQYKIIHKKIQNYFGPYCGYAQQFLFKMEREKFQKNWVVNP